MPTEELSEASESQDARLAIPGWVWSDRTAEEPAQPVDLAGILKGLGELLVAMGAMP